MSFVGNHELMVGGNLVNNGTLRVAGAADYGDQGAEMQQQHSELLTVRVGGAFTNHGHCLPTLLSVGGSLFNFGRWKPSITELKGETGRAVTSSQPMEGYFELVSDVRVFDNLTLHAPLNTNGFTLTVPELVLKGETQSSSLTVNGKVKFGRIGTTVLNQDLSIEASSVIIDEATWVVPSTNTDELEVLSDLIHK